MYGASHDTCTISSRRKDFFVNFNPSVINENLFEKFPDAFTGLAA